MPLVNTGLGGIIAPGLINVSIVEAVALGADVVRFYFDNTFGVDCDDVELAGMLVQGAPIGYFGGGHAGENFIDLEYTSAEVGDTWEVDYVMPIGSQRRIFKPQTGTIGGAGGAITVSSLASTTAEFVDDTTKGLSGGDTLLRPAATPHPRFLFGEGNNTSHLYRMAEGETNWTKIYSTALGNQGYVWSWPNGYMLATAGWVGPGNNYLKRSTDDGANWSTVIGPGTAPEILFSTNGYLVDWSVALGPNGTAIAGEYSTSGGRYIFFTNDYGATWTVAVDNNALAAADQWTHVHACHYHAATGKFVVGVGDTTKSRIFTLDAAGANLANLVNLPNSPQPVWFQDGVGNEVIYGDDVHSQVSILNVATGAIRRSFDGLRGMDSGLDYFWHIAKYDGLYYAFQTHAAAGASLAYDRVETVLIVAPSPDGPWTVAYVFPNTHTSVKSFAGFLNGVLHFKSWDTAGSAAHWVVNPIELTVKGAAAANGTRTNTEPSTAASSDDGWFGYYITRDTGTGLGIGGGDCRRITCNGNPANVPQFGRASATYAAAVTAGKVYQAQCWVKVTTSRGLFVLVSESQDASISISKKTSWYCPAGQWTLVKTPAFKVLSGKTKASMQFQLAATDNIAAEPPVLLIDRMMVTEAPCPNEWIANGSPLAETAHAGTLEARPKWTDLFWFEPADSHHRTVGHGSVATGPQCIRSWKVGTSIIELWMWAGECSTLNGIPTWSGGKTTIVANGGIFYDGMEGFILHGSPIATSAPLSALITNVDSSTQVKVDQNLSTLANLDNVIVEAPRFELRITDGVHNESIWSPRIPWLQGCGMGFAVQVGGASDDKVRAWIMHGGTLHFFEASGYTHTDFISAEITTHFGASSLTAERAFSGAVGKFLHLGDYGYIPEDQLPDVIPTGSFDDTQVIHVLNDVKVNQVAHINGGQDNTQLGWEFRTQAGNYAYLAHELAELVLADVEGLQVQVDGIWYKPISLDSAALDYIAVTYAVAMDSSLGQRFRTRTVNLEFFENAIGDLPNGLEYGREGIVSPYA